MINPTLLSNDNLWCGYFLTYAQKRELIVQALEQFKRPVNKRVKPFQLVELVRHMIKM